MRRVGLRRIILILLVLGTSLAFLGPQNVDIPLFGARLERGGDTVLGLKLGLDLQGGIHLVYQAQGTKQITVVFQSPPDIERMRTVFNDLGKAEVTLQEEDNRTVIIGVNTLRAAQFDIDGSVLQRAETDLIREALELQVGPLAANGFTAQEIEATPSRDQMEGVLDTIERRINPFGVAEPVIQLMGSNRVLVQLPGISDVEEVKRLIGQTARLEFRERTCFPAPANCNTPEGHEPDKDTGLTGEDLDRAYAGTHPQKGVPIVNLEFNSRGTRIFRDMTTRLAGTPDRFVIYLDEDELIAPVVIQPILTGNSFIEGPTFTPESVRTLGIQLESGRLPIPITVVTEQEVDATLGAESLRKSLIAGIAGLALVLVFMVLYYRAAGVVAALALLVYTAAVLAVFKLIPVTLTLGGIAAFILSIGMAVDANILIFERMKEELRLGRTLGAAIEIGFNRAWRSIRDSNLSTLITCVILFWFGQRLGNSLISGFALTLGIGVVLSMFSALTVSRTLLHLMGALGLGERRNLFTPEPLPSPASASRPAPGAAEEGS